MGLSIRSIDCRIANLRTRMPFRYGIASMTVAPHLFVSIEAAIDGRPARGISADILPPKWFTKDPQTAYKDDLRDMFEVIRAAGEWAVAAGSASSAFELWRRTYQSQQRWAQAVNHPPLLWGFGVSLIERAMIDAVCRAGRTTFAQAVRDDRFGIDLPQVHPTLEGLRLADLLPDRPLRSVRIRHTVGMADPLTDDAIPPAEELDDGLPQSLEQCIRTYGLTRFKIKLSGDAAQDVDRLKSIAQVLSRCLGEYAFTLDGNESFRELGAFKAFWRELAAHAELADFLRYLIFVEQPLHREVALSDEVRAAMILWHDRPAMIIDESDATLDSLPRALACGYSGTSHKNCKGVFRGLANAALIESLRRQHPGTRYILSGEDLANVGPVALLQDLAVMASLGIAHVERNGHHYFNGLSMFAPPVQQAILDRHGDLYRAHGGGYPSLDIHDGRIELGSVVDAPFGVAFEPDLSSFTPMNEWRYESLSAS